MRVAGTGEPHITIATLLIALGMIAGSASGERTVAPIDQPQFLQIEAIEAVALGASYAGRLGPNLAVRILKTTWHSGKGLRAGISGLDLNGTWPIGYEVPSGWSIAPVHIGYDIVFRPVRSEESYYSTIPSCYVEATLGAFPPYAKLAVACDIDYNGVGTGIEVGVVNWNQLPSYPPGRWTARTFVLAPYASLKLRLVDVAFRLARRK